MDRTFLLYLVSLFFHVILLYCPQDIHFTVTEIDGNAPMVPQIHPRPPPTKRLVLFVVDLVSAHSLFAVSETGESNLPFLRQMITKKGRWGIVFVQSQVTTNGTRKYHNAIVTGASNGRWTYINDRDSIFNATTHNWVWSNVDGLNYLSGLGAKNSDIFVFSNNYLKQTSPFVSNMQLDQVHWMSKHVEDLFLVKGNEEKIAQQLAKDKSLFYFNMISLNSSESINSNVAMSYSVHSDSDLASIDNAVRNITNLFESYYLDSQTAFVFTAIQRQRDTGEAIMLPFISWGAGIKNPRSRHHSTLTYEDDLAHLWKLEGLERLDVNQEDIAPLLSILLGIKIPVHSLGVVPVGYIHYNKEFIAEALFTNAMQLLELVHATENVISSHSLPFMFRPYSKLPRTTQEQLKWKIIDLINKRKLQESFEVSTKLIVLCKEAIEYYKSYHQFSLKIALTLALVGWIIYLMTVLAKDNNENTEKPARNGLYYILCIAVTFIVIGSLVLYQHMPFHYVIYFCLPILFWDRAFHNRQCLIHAVQESSNQSTQFLKKGLLFVLIVLAIEVMVFSFYSRFLLAVLFFVLSLWPYTTKLAHKGLYLALCWTVSCLGVASYVFVSSPAISTFVNSLSSTLAGLTVACLVLYLLFQPSVRHVLTIPSSLFCSSRNMFLLQLVQLVVSIVIVNIALWSNTSSMYVLGFSWGILSISIIFLLIQPQSVIGRLLYITLELFTLFLLLSASSESLFFILLSFLLYLWLLTEDKLIPSKNKTAIFWDGLVSYSPIEVVSLVPQDPNQRSDLVTMEDIRRASMTCIFAVASLLCLGETRSLFDIASSGLTMPCFPSSTTPVLASLTTLKLFLPILVIACAYNTLSSLLNMKFHTKFLLFLLISDYMALHFFLFIETSDTKLNGALIWYHVTLLLSIVLPVILGIAQLMTGRAIIPRKLEEHLN